MTRSATVSSQVKLRLVMPEQAPLAVQAGLSYELDDPYAVTVSFHTGGDAGETQETVCWTFGRALLSDGLSAPSGAGDVQVWPGVSGGEQVVCLSLTSPSGSALFEVPLDGLMAFLGQTYRAVPAGTESSLVDVDSELALLLGDDWAL